MEIRDVIHGTIEVSEAEEQIISSAFFQRLKNIKQLGFAENSFPGATHNRFIHSLGALNLATAAFQNALKGARMIGPRKREQFLACLRAAAVLHDIGHGPLSHTTEFAMQPVEKLGLTHLKCLGDGLEHPFGGRRRANHEDYSLKIILQSSLTPILCEAYCELEVEPIHIACIVNEQLVCPGEFFMAGGINFRPILHQIISSELDVDRMDYLSRDSFYTGVNYGKFDIDWLLQNLSHHIDGESCYLAIKHRAIYTFDDFLISRYHMFLMVYFHHKSVIFDEMLGRYLKSEDCNYSIPTDIESYVFYDDYHLYTHLSRSSNPWAKRIYHKNPYRMLAEFHSGLPLGEHHAKNQKTLFEHTVSQLEKKSVDYIVKATTSEFSKYFKTFKTSPIFVRYSDNISDEAIFPLEQCTDLFERYSANRTITRIYVPN